jgi:hypothetical protein
MTGGDDDEFLAVGVAALDFVKTARRVSGPSDDGSACENIVHERSGLSAVKQAGARLGFQTNSHSPLGGGARFIIFGIGAG